MLDYLLTTLSKNLPTAMMVLVWVLFLRASRTSGWRMAIVSLPGTWLHELAHWFVGLILGARPVSFSLWPKKDGNSWVLGSVGFERLNIWNAAPVTLAPLLLFGLGWAAFEHLLAPAFQSGDYILWAGMGYPVAASLYSGTPSSTDMRVGALSICMYSAFAYLIWQFTA